jgi:hypothetical protein
LPGIRSWFENVAQLQLLFGRIEYHCAHNEQNSGRFSALSRTRSEPDWRLDAPPANGETSFRSPRTHRSASLRTLSHRPEADAMTESLREVKRAGVEFAGWFRSITRR